MKSRDAVRILCEVPIDVKPRWKNERLQKRLVTALGRIGSPAAIPHLRHLALQVKGREEPQDEEQQRAREALKGSIARAIWDVQSRNL